MKKTLLFLLALVLLAACKNNQKGTSAEDPLQTEKTPEPVGADLDENGCKGSAGETWSQLLEQCIRTFEVAQRLDPVGTLSDSEAVLSAFVLLNLDQDKAEVYLPDLEGSAILEQQTDSTYGGVSLLYNRLRSTLSTDGVVVYQAP